MIVDLVPLRDNSNKMSTAPPQAQQQGPNVFDFPDVKNSLNSGPMSPEQSKPASSPGIPDNTPYLEEWGFTLKQLYNLALSFFKGEIREMTSIYEFWNR